MEFDYICHEQFVRRKRTFALKRMKAGFLLVVFGMVIAMFPLSASPTASGFSVVSPDQPAIWYNRSGDEVSRELSWDRSEDVLVLYLAYDTIENLTPRDQWYYDKFRLAFPDVRLNEVTNTLFFVDKKGRHVTVARLEDGVLGRRVVLEDGVQLEVNRRDGVIRAKITSASGAAEKPVAR
jgi:hypothetical protein